MKDKLQRTASRKERGTGESGVRSGSKEDGVSAGYWLSQGHATEAGAARELLCWDGGGGIQPKMG